LSPIEEPTTTTPRPTAGGEVIWNSPGQSSRMPIASLISPPLPKSAQGIPVFASSAIRRTSLVPMKIRDRQAAFAGALSSTQ
jgi:hypothetical protein